MARAASTSDVFNAMAETHRREILDALREGEKPVGAIVDELTIPQPQVSKHLRVLSDVGLVTCRAEGRRRLYRLEAAQLGAMREWSTTYEQLLNVRLNISKSSNNKEKSDENQSARIGGVCVPE